MAASLTVQKHAGSDAKPIPPPTPPPAEETKKSSRATPGYCRPLSKLHVNMVEVPGERFKDVFFDDTALAVTPDLEKGQAYIRVKPGFALTHDETSAFFNTPDHTYLINFCLRDIPAQRIEIASRGVKTPPTSQAAKEVVSPPDLPPRTPVSHTADPFEATVKELVRFAYGPQTRAKAPTVGMTVLGAQKHVNPTPLAFAPRTISWQGFHVRQRRAWATSQYVVEELAFTNLSTYERRVPYAEAARAARGAVAVASTAQRVGSGLSARVILVRERAAAETTTGVVLTADDLLEKTL